MIKKGPEPEIGFMALLIARLIPILIKSHEKLHVPSFGSS
jgi:hypothetical protein